MSAASPAGHHPTLVPWSIQTSIIISSISRWLKASKHQKKNALKCWVNHEPCWMVMITIIISQTVAVDVFTLSVPKKQCHIFCCWQSQTRTFFWYFPHFQVGLYVLELVKVLLCRQKAAAAAAIFHITQTPLFYCRYFGRLELYDGCCCCCRTAHTVALVINLDSLACWLAGWLTDWLAIKKRHLKRRRGVCVCVTQLVSGSSS